MKNDDPNNQPNSLAYITNAEQYDMPPKNWTVTG